MSVSVSRLLAVANFEVIPLQGTLEKSLSIPAGSTVAVTASPSRGIAATVELATALQDRGYRAVPHLAGRMFEDRHQLASVVKELDAAGVNQVFVVGGDGDRQGDYPDAGSLLADLSEIGHPFLEVGIAGYPEGHPAIPDEALREALLRKQAHATYLVTQMCFKSRAIVDWVASIRGDGVTLPVKVGVPGVIDPLKLFGIAARIGVGDSRRYLAKNRRVLGRLLRPGSYRPDRLIGQLAAQGDDEWLAGLHLYTFNQVEATVAWYRRATERAR